MFISREAAAKNSCPPSRKAIAEAQRCRELLKVARVPEVVEQLRMWATEFEAEARKNIRGQEHKRGGVSMLRRRSRA